MRPGGRKGLKKTELAFFDISGLIREARAGPVYDIFVQCGHKNLQSQRGGRRRGNFLILQRGTRPQKR